MSDNKIIKNDGIRDVNEDSQIINDDKYNVEVANDFSIPNIASPMYDVSQQIISGYTAGLITRDLVAMGEEIVKNKDNQNQKK